MKPMFSYFGAKYRLSAKYPKPLHDIVVEPFAGSACYSLRHNVSRAILYDINPKVAGVWDFLIHASEQDILALPLDFDDVNDLLICQEAKWFIGFGLSMASTAPRNKITTFLKVARSKGHANGWTEQKRALVAKQVNHIRDWEIHNKDYRECPPINATWFIDPPYVTSAGTLYPNHSINRDDLAGFSWSREGLVINCDDISATYLPFIDGGLTKGARKDTQEGVFVRSTA